MRKTKKECEELYEKFKEYCKTAEQEEFLHLLILDNMIRFTIENYDEIKDEELDSMFKVVGSILNYEGVKCVC